MSAAPRIAVFGAGGQLGCALVRVGRAHGISVSPFPREKVDVSNFKDVSEALGAARATLAINAAAYTAVDKAESDRERAFAVNCDGARNVAQAAANAGMPVVHISTDYVFDGKKVAAYVEDDPVAPLGVYGTSKAEGEAAVRRVARRAVIVRTSWVFGLEGANFVKTMLRLGRERDTLRVVNDQRGCPTFADDLAAAILSISARVSGSAWGTYHLAGHGQATWFEFAEAVFALAARYGQSAPKLEPITTADYPRSAQRPANSVLDCAKAKHAFGSELPHWKDGLSRMLEAHLATVERRR